MYNLKQIGRVIFSAVVAVAFSTSTAVADNTTDSDTATASAYVVQALGLRQATALEFGKFVAPGDDDIAGTVVIAPTFASTRTSTNGVYLLNDIPYAAGFFLVNGEPNAAYGITIPDTTIKNSNNDTMTVSLFTSLPTTDTAALDVNGQGSIYVGATLNVAKNQAGGEYQGTYNVTVTYK